MTTTREAALEAALNEIMSSDSYESRETFDGSNKHVVITKFGEFGQIAHEALSTPATEPKGYVEGQDINDAICAALGDAMDCTRVWEAWHYGTMSDEDFVLVRDDAARVDEIVEAINNALAARPAPQPAVDTRVVGPQCCMCGKLDLSTVEDDGGAECELHDGRWVCSSDCYDHAIIGNATPAPSDKIAEAARVLLDAPGDVMTGFAIDVMRANRLRDGNRIGYQPAIISALRALAGKGE